MANAVVEILGTAVYRRTIRVATFCRHKFADISKFVSPWRNWLARSAVNRKVGGSSPPGA